MCMSAFVCVHMRMFVSVVMTIATTLGISLAISGFLALVCLPSVVSIDPLLMFQSIVRLHDMHALWFPCFVLSLECPDEIMIYHKLNKIKPIVA